MVRGVVILVGVFLVGCNSVFGIDPPIHDSGTDAIETMEASDAIEEAPCEITDGEVCSLAPQCGCENQSCLVVDLTGTRQCSSFGTTPLYWPCSSPVGDCVLGAQCIGGVCKPLCNRDMDCGSGRYCIQIQDTGGGQAGKDIPGLKVCSSACDPMNPSATCGPGATCGAVFRTLSSVTSDCLAPHGTGMGPGACANNYSACAPGWACLATGPHAGACSKYCRKVGHPEDCPMNQTCESFGPNLIVKGIEYGSCN